jgi:hypothetical protein
MTLIDLLYFSLILLVILAIFAVIWMLGGFFLAHSVDRKYRACPQCKRLGAGTITATEIEPLGTRIDRSKLTPFRVKRERVTDQYQCDYCQHTWTKSFEREDHTPMQGTPGS